MKKYYFFAGQMVAMKDSGGFKYFLSDHLGSNSVVLDASGAILSQQRYLPFGGARTMAPYANITQTDLTYTGQRNLPDIGLMDYKARFYSPALGRFIQPDSIIPSAANPQSWNRYSYVQNTPVNASDPTGHKCVGDVGECLEDDKPVNGAGESGDTDTDGDGIPNIPDPEYPPITPGRGEDADCVPGNLVECFYNHGYMPAGDYNISWSEFWLLMKAISYDIDQRDSLTDYSYRGWYDTPFYDGGLNATAGGPLKSNLCIQMLGCFERHELNYIAQGQASAKAYEGRVLMAALIVGWKMDQYEGSMPSYKTLRAANIGYNYYTWTHGSNILTEFLPLKNPIPFANTVRDYCQMPEAHYC